MFRTAGSAGNRGTAPDDYLSMACTRYHEALSARIDGEDGGVPEADLDVHLTACADCRRFAQELADLHRLARVRAAERVPDLTGSILAAADGPPVRALRAVSAETVARITLAITGLVLVAISAPDLLAGESGSNHLAAWDIAFGAGLLVAARRTDRSRALIPFAAVLVAAMTIAAVADAHHGHVADHGLSHHLLEVAGLALLWWCARASRALDGPSRTTMRAA